MFGPTLHLKKTSKWQICVWSWFASTPSYNPTFCLELSSHTSHPSCQPRLGNTCPWVFPGKILLHHIPSWRLECSWYISNRHLWLLGYYDISKNISISATSSLVWMASSSAWWLPLSTSRWSLLRFNKSMILFHINMLFVKHPFPFSQLSNVLSVRARLSPPDSLGVGNWHKSNANFYKYKYSYINTIA